MSASRLKSLFDKYLSNSMNQDELEEFLTLLEQLDESLSDQLFDKYADLNANSDIGETQFNKGEILQKVLGKIESEDVAEKGILRFQAMKWLGLAASILIVFGFFFLRDSPNYFNDLPEKGADSDICLVEDGAPLILRTDGKEFQVAGEINATIEEEGLTVTTDEKGNRLYKLSRATRALSESRTFISPKGTSLQVELEDGTRLWLNSGASVTYPAVFAADKREIAIAGEAFLDVAHNKSRPFILKTNKTEIRVLGTEFNVASDKRANNVETTLVTGSIEVSVGGRSKLLKPGFKSITSDHDEQINIQKADLKAILAWKDGYFRFDDDQIETVIAKIREWYDIGQVSYLRNSDEEFSGMIKRTKSLNELLRQIEKISTYKFKVQDGRVLVM